MASLKEKYQVTNVFVSAVTPENISRQQLLAWVNDALQSNLTKIEEMSTGAAYCMLTDRLFPGSIPLHKVKWNTKTDVESIANWKLVQNAWHALGITKPVQVQVLLKGKFQDNFEFLQWFRRFYDHNNANYEYDPLEARNHEPFPISAGGKAAKAPVRSVPTVTAANRRVTMVPNAPPTNTVPSAPRVRTSMAPRPATTVNNVAKPGLSAQQEAKYKTEIGELKDQISTWEKTLGSVEGERDYYYQKLHKVELLCNDLEPEQTVTVSSILAILYKEDDDGNDLQAFEAVEEQILHDAQVIEDEHVDEEKLLHEEPTPIPATNGIHNGDTVEKPIEKEEAVENLIEIEDPVEKEEVILKKEEVIVVTKKEEVAEKAHEPKLETTIETHHVEDSF
jgi:RP/EB family microtubule-associated protein